MKIRQTDELDKQLIPLGSNHLPNHTFDNNINNNINDKINDNPTATLSPTPNKVLVGV